MIIKNNKHATEVFTQINSIHFYVQLKSIKYAKSDITNDSKKYFLIL